jgi:hypothetical protein
MIVVGVVAVLILRAWAKPMGDFDTVHPVPKIHGIVAAIKPEHQVETFTCGFHAVSAIYRSYGLDPDERRLRPRLGVDNSANIYDKDSTGCLHPDIYRVITQDGFAYQALDLDDANSKQALLAHLDATNCAMALIKRRENGHLHWVVIDGRTNETLRVCDSLKPEIYNEPLEAYWRNCLLSVILIKPATAEQNTPIWKLHLRGAEDMYRASRRM